MLLSTMFNDTLIEAPGAPHPLVMRELRLALDRFCTKSLFWRVTLPPILVLDGETGVTIPGAEGGVDIAFTLPTDSLIAKIVTATFDSFKIQPSSITLMDEERRNWRDTTSGTVRFIERFNGCTLAPAPSTDGYLVPTVALRPAPTATTMDDGLIAYRQTIIDGALAALLMLPTRPWTNPQLAAYYEDVFQRGVDAAHIAVHQDNHAKRRVTSYGGIR